jgi:hypothetical protein
MIASTRRLSLMARPALGAPGLQLLAIVGEFRLYFWRVPYGLGSAYRHP